MTKKVLTFLTIFIVVFYLVGSSTARADDEVTPLADDDAIVLQDHDYNFFLTVGHYVSRGDGYFFRLHNPITIYPDDLMLTNGTLTLRLADNTNIVVPKNVSINDFLSQYEGWQILFGRDAYFATGTQTNVLNQYDSILYGLLFLVGVIALCRSKN